MKAKMKHVVQLELTEKEAMWLKIVMQLPLLGCGQVDGDLEGDVFRRLLFNSLDEALLR